MDGKTNQIVIHSDIQHGQAVIQGTRLPVAVVIGSLAGGMTYEEVMQESGISHQQILDALAYFGELLTMEQAS
ncbi:DUF433 domain-containing protein [Gloeomargarita lithophora]|nr:DUF433 domain-containing protein [Gloeomargarita lithophora]